MRKILAMAAALLAASFPALAAGPFGPPEPEAENGRKALSAGVFLYRTTWQPRTGPFRSIDVSQTQPFLQYTSTAWSFSDRGAVFLRAGGADFSDGEDFTAGYKPYVAFGMKDVWFERHKNPLKVGTIFQATVYAGGYDDDEILLPAGTVARAHVRNRWDAAFAISAQYALGSRLVVFGGPHVLYGRADITRSAEGFTDTATFEEQKRAGLGGGFRLRLGEKWTLEGEGQARGGISYGLSIARSLY